MELNLTAIPEELKARNQWVAWKAVERNGKPTKVPLDPKTGGPAKSNDPVTWGLFDQAVQAARRKGAAGVGFVFSVEDPFCGVDLDHATVDGRLRLCAQELLRCFDSYAETSPSSKGLHLWLKGKLPPGGNRKTFPCGLGIEFYDRGRFFTVTGHHLPDAPAIIADRQAELEALHRQIFDTKEKPQPEGPRLGPALDLSDQELIDRAHQAADGGKFARLWAGDWQGAGYASQSEGDMALACKLAFWCGPDPARIERLFFQSALGKRQKWQSRADYRKLTIREALAQVTEFYSPGKGNPRPEDGQKKPEGGDGQAHGKEKTGGNGPGQGTREGHGGGPQITAIRFVTGAELQNIEFKEPAWVVPGILPEGLCLFSARPKKGKTWWALNVAVAKATGGCALGRQDLRLEQGKVLYLALEDKLRRIQKRLRTILGDAPFPEDLLIADSWPKLDQGGLEALRDFLKEHGDCKLVAIDTFGRVKPVQPKNADAYTFDLAWGGALQSLAQEHQVCILLVYHTRKSEGADPLDDVLGSTGLTGAVDAVLILRRGRGQADATLLTTGRDVEERELALKFHPAEGLWELMGTAAEYAMSKQRQEILELLQQSGPLTPKEVAKMLGKPYENIKKILLRMTTDGGLKGKNGKYEFSKSQ